MIKNLIIIMYSKADDHLLTILMAGCSLAVQVLD